MDKKITINKTKGINKLTFKFPNKEGVYLLVGPNGIGKTTLLVCMDRICNSYAFARGFSHPKNISGYDEYKNSSIQYDVDNTCIKFRKKSTKWASSPRKGNSELLKKFGFTNTIFIKADSKRIDATQEEIERGQQKPADENLIATLNDIFETNKYNNLKKLKVTHGRGKPSSYFNIIKDGRNYYTEKRFSTGEIAIFRLVENIERAENNTLILLDEAEMALHPRVQINLLRYLTNKSQEKNLTVFVSTHSPSMIKATKPSNIFLLEPKTNNTIKVRTPCYPATALGGIDFEESNIFDYIFFVEDDMARYALKKIINRYFRISPQYCTASTVVIPVGGYFETARMAVDTKSQIFSQSKVFALVDADAYENLDSKPKFKELASNNSHTVHSLRFTPEIKFIEILCSDNSNLRNKFRNRMHCEVTNILNNPEYMSLHSTKERKLAKAQFEFFVDKCHDATGDSHDIIISELIEIIINSLSEGYIQSILGPIFNH